MSDLSAIIRQFVQTAPPGNNESIISDIQTLLGDSNGSKLINSTLRDYYTQPVGTDSNTSGGLKLVEIEGELSVVSYYNLEPSKKQKFVDSSKNVSFQYDFSKNQAIDIEANEGQQGAAVTKLQNELDNYIEEHYTELSKGLVIPKEGGLSIVIVGEKLSDANFYNGKWTSVYEYSEQSQRLEAVIRVSVHYYEDGNVRMESSEEYQRTVGSVSGILSEINEIEHAFQMQLLQGIGSLNEDKFKSLRRLLPISRSKIQWGKAIGNYKLGQEVVDSK